MKKNPLLTQAEEVIIYGILELATHEIEFREKMLNNPESVLLDFKHILSEASYEALKMYRRVALEELGVDMRRFRGGADGSGGPSTHDNGFKLS